MNDKSRYLGSVLATMKQLSLAALAAVFLVALPVASNAQETSADMRGMVTDESGNPVPSAAVTIRNDSTGLTRSTTSAADGGYVIRNLPVGQEVYSMTVDGEGFASARRSGVSIILGGTATQDFALSTTGEMEEILVFGTQQSVSQVAVGPTASFGLEALQAAPAINRNIADVLRIDPRIHVDESRGGINAVQFEVPFQPTNRRTTLSASFDVYYQHLLGTFQERHGSSNGPTRLRAFVPANCNSCPNGLRTFTWHHDDWSSSVYERCFGDVTG